jgi:regulator of sigma E protease
VAILAFLFGMSVFVHEAGHFLAARMCGLVVEVFSIGFGPAIWKRKHKGVLYKIGCIPVGGYVALPQLDPTGMSAVQTGADGKERHLPRVAPWRKIVVSLAGAAGNVLLAVLLVWIVYWKGIPGGPSERSSVVGYVAPDSAAYAAGLRIGDEVLAVNKTLVHKWSEVRMEAALCQKAMLRVRAPEGTERVVNVVTEKGLLGEQGLNGVDGRNLCSVLAVEPGMSADKAGVRGGDTVVEFAGREVYSIGHLIALVEEHRDQTVPMKVKRSVDGAETVVTMPVTPVFDRAAKQVRIGIRFNLQAVDYDTVSRPRPLEQLRAHAAGILRVLQALGTPKQAKAASQALGGPVAIVASYWIIVKTSIMLAISFTAFLNVNLAILNLLPIPVLDGGHVMFALWEVVTRRPVPAKVVNALVNVFMILLIGMFLMLSGRDMDRMTPVGRFLRKLWGSGREAVTNAAPAAGRTGAERNAPAGATPP